MNFAFYAALKAYLALMFAGVTAGGPMQPTVAQFPPPKPGQYGPQPPTTTGPTGGPQPPSHPTPPPPGAGGPWAPTH